MEASLFEKILETNLINFLIVMSILIWIFKKIHLGNIIQRMADEIKESVEQSTINLENAKKNLEDTKIATSGTEELQEKIIKQAHASAKSITERIEESTAQKEADIKLNLKKAFENQVENFKNITIDEVYQASVELAKAEVLKRLNKDIHKKLINTSIDELTKVEGNIS